MKHLKETIDFSEPSEKVARTLIGCTFMVDGVGGIIVETEAYDRTDPASHSYPGLTQRNAVMFDEPAHLYVYRSYGIHWCVNIVCREKGHGAAVLLRAIQPTNGIEIMRERRNTKNDRLLCAGPGRLCQALAITGSLNALPLDSSRITFITPEKKAKIITGPRIGITKAVETPWRFGLSGSPYLSRPFRK